MCLWFAQVCPKCDSYTAIPNVSPIVCDILYCYRRDMNPNHLTPQEKFLYLNMDNRCYPLCNYDQCGLMLQTVECGSNRSFREFCYISHSDDSDYSSDSEIHGQREE